MTPENCCLAEKIDWWQPFPRPWRGAGTSFFSYLLLSSLELSDTKVYEP